MVMGPATHRILNALRDHGCRVTGSGPRWNATCPAHDDHHPSLSILTIPGMVLLKCHADCDTRDVVAALDLTMSDLFDKRGGVKYRYDNGRNVIRTWDKRFWQENTENAPPQLYRLSRVREAVAARQTVLVVEGEKDVEVLATLGVVATTSPMGADNADETDWSPLAGADVKLVPDNDDAGCRYAATVTAKLLPLGCRLTVRYPAEGCKDITDHLMAGHDLDELVPGAHEGNPSPPHQSALTFATAAELCAQVDAAGPVRWLVRELWPSDAYGVLGADPKVGKTWLSLDLAVAVASGTPWLGHLPVDTSGPVIVFAGEGGERNLVRRLRAIAGGRQVALEELPIHVCTRAPHLGDAEHLEALRAKVAEVEPVLLIIDPLYLAALGGNGADLYAMGALLEAVQLACAGRALLIVHHTNRSRDASGGRRLSGAGPQEWGRVLITARVVERPGEGKVVLRLDIEGGEVPEASYRVTRCIHADDPLSLDSPVTYSITGVEQGDGGNNPGSPDYDPGLAGLSRAACRVHAVLGTEQFPATVEQIAELVTHQFGLERPMTRATVQKALGELGGRWLAVSCQKPHSRAAYWYRREDDDE